MHMSHDDCGLRLVSNNTRGNSKRLVSLRPSAFIYPNHFPIVHPKHEI